MKKLKQTKKITMATLKSFAKRNGDSLYFQELRSFSGMTDCVEENEDRRWIKTEITDKTNYYRTGIQGVYTVGSSRDYFKFYEDERYIGIYVYNCCGSWILATKK